MTITLLGSAAQVVEKDKIRPAYGHQMAKFDKKARSPPAIHYLRMFWP
jgi:hypothetical protein